MVRAFASLPETRIIFIVSSPSDTLVTARKIGELLAASGQLKTLSHEAQRLAELERVIFEAAPRALSEATRLRSFRAGTLVLSTENPAVAAKLRQLVPRLLVYVRNREPEVSRIRVQVQPATPQERARGDAGKKRPLSADAIANFQNLAAGLRESPLKSAVTRLVRRHKKTVNSER